MLFAFFVMLAYFWVEDLLKLVEDETIKSSCALLPSIGYTVLIFIMNMYYRKLATYLTEWGKQHKKSIDLALIMVNHVVF